jgi:hypothetical protein
MPTSPTKLPSSIPLGHPLSFSAPYTLPGRQIGLPRLARLAREVVELQRQIASTCSVYACAGIEGLLGWVAEDLDLTPAERAEFLSACGLEEVGPRG